MLKVRFCWVKVRSRVQLGSRVEGSRGRGGPSPHTSIRTLKTGVEGGRGGRGVGSSWGRARVELWGRGVEARAQARRPSRASPDAAAETASSIGLMKRSDPESLIQERFDVPSPSFKHVLLVRPFATPLRRRNGRGASSALGCSESTSGTSTDLLLPTSREGAIFMRPRHTRPSTRGGSR